MKKGLFFVIWMALLAAPLAAQTIEVSGEYQGQVLWDADTVNLWVMSLSSLMLKARRDSPSSVELG